MLDIVLSASSGFLQMPLESGNIAVEIDDFFIDSHKVISLKSFSIMSNTSPSAIVSKDFPHESIRLQVVPFQAEGIVQLEPLIGLVEEEIHTTTTLATNARKREPLNSVILTYCAVVHPVALIV